ncbi:MAG: MSCRAMM family protein [Lachnospiraceae bacterium]
MTNVDEVNAYLNVKIPYGHINIIKESEDGVVAGIKFQVTGEDIDKPVTTGTDGSIMIENLKPGTYTVTELSEERYEPQKVQTVTVVGGETAKVSFSNILKKGSLKVTKTSEDGIKEGMKFRLYGTSLSGIAVDEYATTNADGVAVFEDILISGNTPYTLEEVDTPIRYVVPDSQNVTIAWNDVTNKSMYNILKKFCVTVNKSDVETSKAQGNASLSGAVYGIYNDSQLVDTYTTDENGSFTTAYYVCGDNWTIREITPSEGYLLDETVHKVGASAKNYTVERSLIALDVTEEIIKGKVSIIKHTDNGDTQIETPEEGAKFQIYLASAGSYDKAEETERDTLVCDEYGYAVSKDLPYGICTVHQLSGWEGRELMSDFQVYIAENSETYRYLINNANFESYIKIVKVDAETGKNILYAGAGFQIYDPQGNLVTMTYTYPEVTTIDTFYTSEEGYLITPEKLEYGTGYTLVEVQAPYGYVLDSTPISFDVKEDNSSEESGIKLIKVERTNMAQKGVIKISKTGEVFYSVETSGGESGKEGELTGDAVVYTPIYKTEGLPGAVYDIIADEDIVTQDGTVRAKKNEVVDTVTTGEDGSVNSIELYLGLYRIVEKTAPEGMVLNSESYTVELTYAGQEVAVTETSAEYYNERQKVMIELLKSMELDEDFEIGSNSEVQGVAFGLYAAEDIIAADGTVIPADGLIEVLFCNNEGRLIFTSDVPFGSYYVKEVLTNQHYLISDIKYTVEFSYQGQEVALVSIKANEGEAIENTLKRGRIEGLKYDEEGKLLAGVVFGLFRTDADEFGADTAILTATTLEDGSFSFEDVPYGNWIIREIETLEGYVLSEETITVTISEDGEVIVISMINEFIRGKLQLTKVDEDYPDNKLTGATFEVYEDTNKDKKLDEGDQLIGELEEIETGIYEMDDVLYGGYFVKESEAPDGFVLDQNAYYVEIENHGETVTVENEAGVGFLNTPQKGHLKIQKSSSDGKLEGFSFRVTGENGYDETYKTNSKGEILIEDLRIGEYTVSEVSDNVSAGYVLPADQTVTVAHDETTLVEMHNTVKETPKTGDDSNVGLWLGILAITVIGAVVFGVLFYKDKKKKNTKK